MIDVEGLDVLIISFKTHYIKVLVFGPYTPLSIPTIYITSSYKISYPCLLSLKTSLLITMGNKSFTTVCLYYKSKKCRYC